MVYKLHYGIKKDIMNLKFVRMIKMNYDEFKNLLFENRDEKNAAFVTKLANTDYRVILGIKSPVLQKIVKNHYRDEELVFEKGRDFEVLEVVCSYFYISLLRIKDFKGQLDFIEDNLKYARSWIVTDGLNHYLRKPDFELFEKAFDRLSVSEHEYARRYAYVLAMKFQKEERIVSFFDKFRFFEPYMTMMGQAWLLSCVAIWYEDETYSFLKGMEDTKLKLKTISKISDSFRFSQESKDRFKALRKD